MAIPSLNGLLQTILLDSHLTSRSKSFHLSTEYGEAKLTVSRLCCPTVSHRLSFQLHQLTVSRISKPFKSATHRLLRRFKGQTISTMSYKSYFKTRTKQKREELSPPSATLEKRTTSTMTNRSSVSMDPTTATILEQSGWSSGRRQSFDLNLTC